MYELASILYSSNNYGLSSDRDYKVILMSEVVDFVKKKNEFHLLCGLTEAVFKVRFLELLLLPLREMAKTQKQFHAICIFTTF